MTNARRRRAHATSLFAAGLLAACTTAPSPAVTTDRTVAELHDEADAALLATTQQVAAAVATVVDDWEVVLVGDAAPVALCETSDGEPTDEAWVRVDGELLLQLAETDLTTTDRLRAALDGIAAPDGWTQGSADGPSPLVASGDQQPALLATGPEGDVSVAVVPRPRGPAGTDVAVAVTTACVDEATPTGVDDVEAAGFLDSTSALLDAAAPPSTTAP